MHDLKRSSKFEPATSVLSSFDFSPTLALCAAETHGSTILMILGKTVWITATCGLEIVLSNNVLRQFQRNTLESE